MNAFSVYVDLITFLVQSIDSTINVEFDLSISTCCLVSEKIININLNGNEYLDDCGFLRHLYESHKCDFTNEYSIILWAILHEIGHCITQVEDNDADIEKRLLLQCTNDAHSVEIQDLYFNLSSEYAATEWAIQWITENPQKAFFIDLFLCQLIPYEEA